MNAFDNSPFLLHEFPKIQEYLRDNVQKVNEDRHKKIVEYARERIHPHQGGWGVGKALRKLAWTPVEPLIGVAKIANSVWNWDKAILSRAGKYEGEWKLTSFTRKRQWLDSLKADAEKRNDIELARQVQQLEKLLYNPLLAAQDVIQQLKGMPQLKLANFKGIDKIPEQIYNNDIDEAINAIESFKKAHGNDRTLRPLINKLHEAAILGANPAKIFGEELLAGHITNIIDRTPIHLVIALKNGLQTNPQGLKWQQTLFELKREIGGNKPNCLKLLKEIEKTSNRLDYSTALKKTEHLLERLLQQMLPLFNDCANHDKTEVIKAVIEDLPEEFNQLKIDVLEVIDTDLGLVGEMIEEELRLNRKTASGIQEQTALRHLINYLKTDSSQLLQSTLEKIQASANNEAIETLLDNASKQKVHPQLESVDRLINYIQSQNDNEVLSTTRRMKKIIETAKFGESSVAELLEELSRIDPPPFLEDPIETLKQLLDPEKNDHNFPKISKTIQTLEEKASHQELLATLRDVRRQILSDTSGLTAKWGKCLSKLNDMELKEVPGHLMEQGKQMGMEMFIEHLREGRDKTDQSTEEGVLQAQAYDLMLAFIDTENTDRLKSLTSLFEALYHTKGKSWLVSLLEKKQIDNAEPPLAQNIRGLEDYFATKIKDSSALEAHADLLDIKLLYEYLNTDNREGAIAYLKQQKYNLELSNQDPALKRKGVRYLADCLQIIEKNHSGMQEHIREGLSQILETDGKNFVEDLSNMISTIAQNEGVIEIDKQLEKMKNNAEPKAKIKAFDNILQDFPIDEEDRGSLPEIRAFLEKGENENATATLEKLKRPGANDGLCNAVTGIIENPQAELQISLLQAFQGLLIGDETKGSFSDIFEALRNKSDQVLLKNIADKIIKKEGKGLEELWQELSSASKDKSSIPANLERILKYCISKEGRHALGDFGARRIAEAIMDDREINLQELDDETFGAKIQERLTALMSKQKIDGVKAPDEESSASDLQKLLRLFKNWATTGRGIEWLIDEQLLQPLLDELGGDSPGAKTAQIETMLNKFLGHAQNLEELSADIKFTNKDKIQKILLSSDGATALIRVLVKGVPNKMANGAELPTKADMLATQAALDADLSKVGDGPGEMATALGELIIKKIKDHTKDIQPDPSKDVNLGSLILKQQEEINPGQLIYFTNIGKVRLCMDEKDFRLAIDVALKEMLLKGQELMTNAAQGKDGYNFTCDLAERFCLALTDQLENPGQPIKWDDAKSTKQLFDTLLGEDAQGLTAFTPFTQGILKGLMVPGDLTGLPFTLLKVKPFGEEIVRKIYSGDLYKKMFDDILANKFKEKLDKIAKGGNVYDYFLRSKFTTKKKIELSPEEKNFQKQFGKLGLILLEKFDPEWRVQLEERGLDDTFIDNVGKFMIGILRDYMKEELGKDHDDISVDDMYNYSLSKSAKALTEQTSETLTYKEESEKNKQVEKQAVENLVGVIDVLKPLMKHHSLAGLIVGGIIHFFKKIFTDYIPDLFRIVRAEFSKRILGREPDAEEVIEPLDHSGPEKARERMAARNKIYTPLRDAIQSDRLWKRVFKHVLVEGIINPTP